MGGRVLVAGAGIGGLAVGRLLREAGFEVEILERASSLVPGGAGITLWPNATRVLQEVGVAGLLPQPRTYPDSGLRRWDGRLLVPTDISELAQRYGAPMLFLQRTTLHGALLSDGMEALVRTDAEVVRAEESAEGVRVETRSGESFEGDLLIGADGVRSQVRSVLLHDGPPRPCGIVAYRALIESPPLDLDPGEYWGPGSVFALVPVDKGRLFWLATKRAAPGAPFEPDPIPGLLKRHRDWVPGIAQVIEATPSQEVLQHELLDRRPPKRWVGSRIALLGDAAHPMLPFLGQGACQALEDAQALARALRTTPEIPSALRVYQAQRRKRAASITTSSRRIGKIAHLRAAPMRVVRDRAVAAIPDRIRWRQIDKIVTGS